MEPQPLRLFPLPVVLLPEEGLPLHIFEDRFKQMIGECLEEDLPFGVVLAEKRGVRQTGCTARVIHVIEKLPDGRMNILTRGERRFRLLRTYSHRPYPLGDVEFLDDAPGPPPAGLAGLAGRSGPSRTIWASPSRCRPRSGTTRGAAPSRSPRPSTSLRRTSKKSWSALPSRSGSNFCWNFWK